MAIRKHYKTLWPRDSKSIEESELCLEIQEFRKIKEQGNDWILKPEGLPI